MNLAAASGEDLAFQFTPLREGLRYHEWEITTAGISIHAPARGASTLLFLRQSKTYFNSRPCERGFAIPKGDKHCWKISIHAPARGASLLECEFTSWEIISIHAPARGASMV